MSYELTDAEFSRLEMVLDQLDLTKSLLMLVDDTSLDCVPSRGLFAFLCAREEEMRAVLRSSQERADAEVEAMRMSPNMWQMALRIARGDALHTPSGAEASVRDRLEHEAEINPEMQPVLEEWLEVLETTPDAKPVRAPRTRARKLAA